MKLVCKMCDEEITTTVNGSTEVRCTVAAIIEDVA